MLCDIDKMDSVLGSRCFTSIDSLCGPLGAHLRAPYGFWAPPIHPLSQVHHPVATIQHRLLSDPLAHLKPINPNY